jgi:hypothetical protein
MKEVGAAPTPTERGNSVPKNPFADVPMNKAYIGRATPRGAGGGWEVRVFMVDPEAPDQQRLVGLTECGTLNQLEDNSSTGKSSQGRWKALAIVSGVRQDMDGPREVRTCRWRW